MYLKETNEFGRLAVAKLGGDYNVHILVGCLLPLSIALLFQLETKQELMQKVYWLFFPLIFIADEYLQSFSTVRSSNLYDLLMSALGWVIGCSLWWLIWLLRRGKQH